MSKEELEHISNIYPSISGQGLNMDGIKPDDKVWLNFRQYSDTNNQWELQASVEVIITDFNETSIRCMLVDQSIDESLLNTGENPSKELHWRKHTYFSYRQLKQ